MMVQDMHCVIGELEGKHKLTLTVEEGYLAQRRGIFHQVIQKHLPWTAALALIVSK